MWIDGRRAFRPDGKYYRNIRRARLSGSAGRRGSAIGTVVALIVVALFAAAWFFIAH